MNRVRLVPLALALAGSALAAPPANAGPGGCVAVSPGAASCSYQTAGVQASVSCYSHKACVASFDGRNYYMGFGGTIVSRAPYGTSISVTVYGVGFARATEGA